MASTDQPLCSFTSSALPLESLLVLDWQGQEAISQPYRFDVSLASQNPLLDDEAMLGKPACLTLFDAMGAPHPYHGVISQVEQLDCDDQYFYFRVVLEPRMALLRQQRFSEIWLDKSLPELIRAVLFDVDLIRTGPGLGSDSEAEGYDFDIRLAQDDLALNPVNFTCQFEETSFDFLSRMLEYYGVYYFFEQQADHEALVLCGDLRYQPQVPIALTYFPMHSTLEAAEKMSVVRSFRLRRSSQSRTVVLQDFSASAAQLQLKASASVADACLPSTADAEHRTVIQASAAFRGEYGLYGEHLGSNNEGVWLATRRAQAIGCRHREFYGSGSATGVRAGYPMQLLNHQNLAFNIGYQVIEVRHDGSQPLPGLGDDKLGRNGSSSTSFIALPGDIQFRAPCITPRPNVQGLLSAVIDGDDNSTQPLLNEHGCYKVIFPFVRGDKASTRGSAWLRMATMSSGANHGMHFPLLKGAEVLISFIGGDPDRPIITGSVPNSENPNIVNASNATQSGFTSPGGHYLSIDDNEVNSRVMLGAPAGNTSLTLGQNGATGAQLSTNSHMGLASSSFHQEVSGIYSKKIMPIGDDAESGIQSSNANTEGAGPPSGASEGAGAPAPAAADPSKLKKSKTSSTNLLTGMTNYNKINGMLVETNTAASQVSASLCATKVELNVVGAATTWKLGGAIHEYAANVITRKYGKENKKVVAKTEDVVLVQHNKICASVNETVARKETSGTYVVTAEIYIQNCVGFSIIALNAKEAYIAAPTITLKGNVVIEGKLTVGGGISCIGALNSEAGITTMGQVVAESGSFANLKATSPILGTLSEFPVPDPAAAESMAGVTTTEAGFELLRRDADAATDAATQVPE
ncbi:type VI secretion system Vgr family protein [Pseudomonas sp. EA_65y_Pfl1_P113]|uniref:type VI secretion system Vgr family protein n=1 Tax=Pseudomonas sp. EA_65y_Pfl1_P113 TaxID=3088692 RepID=UPI0030DAB06B